MNINRSSEEIAYRRYVARNMERAIKGLPFGFVEPREDTPERRYAREQNAKLTKLMNNFGDIALKQWRRQINDNLTRLQLLA